VDSEKTQGWTGGFRRNAILIVSKYFTIYMENEEIETQFLNRG
jgi:hypothetical protein